MTGKILIGPAGWSYKDWDGVVYPSRPGSRFDRLAWIADWFDLVEVNVSFYRIPSPAMSTEWVRRVAHNPAFRFTAKLHRDLTHEGVAPDSTVMAEWKAFAEPLAASGRLASCLVQFPWSFRDTPEGRDRIESIAAALSPLPVAVEVRHGSFGDPSWVAWLSGRSIAATAIDQPSIGDSLGPQAAVTSGYSYVRFHGRNAQKWFNHEEAWERYDYLYSAEEMAPWADRISTLARKGDVLVVMNNHWRGQAAVNAVEMKRRLKLPAPVPPPLAAAYPDRFPSESLLG